MKPLIAKFGIGQVVKHRKYPFRGIIYDVDPVFSNTDEWWHSIPEEVRPRKDQPFYHLFAENSETEYIAYVSEQNLLPDTSGDPTRKSMKSSCALRMAPIRSGPRAGTNLCPSGDRGDPAARASPGGRAASREKAAR